MEVKDGTTVNVKMAVARLENGMDQTQLAEKVGCSRIWLNKVERGKFEPSADLARRIEKALEVEPGELFPDK